MTCELVSDLKVSDLISVPACGPKVLLSAQAEDRTSLGPYGLPTSTNLLSRNIQSLGISPLFNLWEKYPWKIECFLEDLFLGSQWSIILGYRRLSVKSLNGR